MEHSEDSHSTESHSDWKIILADESSRQVVLYNSVLEELQVRPPEASLTLNTTLKCSLCNRPFLSEPAYFTFLRSHHQTTSSTASPSTTPTSNEPNNNIGNSIPLLTNTISGYGIPKSSFDEGYYSRFFREIKKLGRGAGGSVFHCQHILNTNTLGSYAVKKIPVGDDPRWLAKMLREAQVLAEISKHPNVIEYKHCWLETWQPTPFGPPVPTLHLLMELVDGPNLEDALGEGLLNARDGDGMLSIFEEIVGSIRHLHSLDILHRDLKPGNILLRPKNGCNYTAVVTDFGECQRSGDQNVTRSGHTGTIEYSAPEVIRGERYSKAADIWSLGIILYQLLTGSMPWKSLDFDVLQKELLELEEFSIRKSDVLPGWSVPLLKQMLQVDPMKRPTADQILADLKSLCRKTTQREEIQYPILTSALIATTLFIACYPCSINLLLIISLLLIFSLRLSQYLHLFTCLLVILYFMLFNQPCTSCQK